MRKQEDTARACARFTSHSSGDVTSKTSLFLYFGFGCTPTSARASLFSGYGLQECAIGRDSGTLDLLCHHKSIKTKTRAPCGAPIDKQGPENLKRALKDLEEVKLMQRTILAGLKGMFHFEKPMIQEIACVDEVDVLILDYLYEAGNAGMLPKDLAAKLAEFRIRRHQVSRRIVRMNKRLEKEIGEQLVEKRGWHWSLTCFAFQSWGDSEIDRQVGEISGDARAKPYKTRIHPPEH